MSNSGNSRSNLDLLTLSNIWYAAWRKRLFLLILLLVGTVGAFVYARIMPETYSTWATVMPPEQESSGGLSSILSSSSIGLDLGELGGGGERSRRFVDILKSRTLCEAVAERCNVREFHQFAPIGGQQLVEALRAAYVYDINNTGLIVVMSALKTPWFPDSVQQRETAEMTACLVNSAIEVLDSLNHAKNVSSARSSRLYIERYMSQTRAELDSIQAELEIFRRDNKILALDEQATAIVQNAVAIGTSIAETQLELEVARQQLDAGTPKVRELQQQLITLKEQYRRIQSGGLVDDDAFSIALDDIPSLSRTYFDFEREIKVREKIHAFLETQRAQEAIQEERDVPTVQVLDDAIAPEQKTSPRVALMTAFGGIVSLLLGLTIVIGQAVRKGTITKDIDLI